MGYIYKITNKINNKIYIGQTTKNRPTDRFSQHKYLAKHLNLEKNNSYLHRAMNVDGIENFQFEVIEKIENIYLNDREKHWIQYYKSKAPNGYNLTDGGDGATGYSRVQTLEEKEKRKQSNIEFYQKNPEKIREISERTKKLWQNEDYRTKVTESNKKFYFEHPDKFKGENNPMYGKKHTEEALKKIRANSEKRKIRIAQLDKNTLEVIQIFDGIKDAEKALNVSHGWLSKAARQNKVAYGYKWKIL